MQYLVEHVLSGGDVALALRVAAATAARQEHADGHREEDDEERDDGQEPLVGGGRLGRSTKVNCGVHKVLSFYYEVPLVRNGSALRDGSAQQTAHRCVLLRRAEAAGSRLARRPLRVLLLGVLHRSAKVAKQ